MTDPLKGGAEIVTFEHAKRWIKDHQADVTWICAKYDKNLSTETLEGVKFVYLGTELKRDNIYSIIFAFPKFFYLVYKEYKQKYQGKVDVVIDEVHGIPFLTPLYVKEKIILYIHEVAGSIWFKMFPWIISIVGKYTEILFLKFYTNVQTVTASQSTKQELISLGFVEEKINIVEHGISNEFLDTPTPKFKNFTLLFLNRIVKMKGPNRAIQIFAKVKESIPETKLIMAGASSEEYMDELKKLAKKLNVLYDIDFKGFVSQKEKINLLQKSHVLINTSYKEGWGLVNLEANSQGTPAVTFDVEGCRDSVKNGINGYISKDESEFVENIIKLKDKDLSQSSIDYSKKYNWNEKAQDFYKVLSK